MLFGDSNWFNTQPNDNATRLNTVLKWAGRDADLATVIAAAKANIEAAIAAADQAVQRAKADIKAADAEYKTGIDGLKSTRNQRREAAQRELKLQEANLAEARRDAQMIS